MQATLVVLLSPALLDFITTYQAGCCADMLMLATVASPLHEVLQPRFLWNEEVFLVSDPFAAFDPVVTAWYAEVGLSRLTKLFACMPRMRDFVVAHAAYSGNLSVLTQLPVDIVRAVDAPLLDLAALKGHLDVLKYLDADVGHDGCTWSAVDCAALQGRLDIVAYLLANRWEGCSMDGVEWAAKYGHLEMVKMLHAHEPFYGLEGALEAAASHNHLAIVAFIVDEFGPAKRYMPAAMNQAAGNGHLEMVQFLHEHNFDCTSYAMDWAAANEHLEVVKWLHENRSEGCTMFAFDVAKSRCNVEVVRWFRVHRPEWCS